MTVLERTGTRDAMRVAPGDNVAVALRDLPAGADLSVGGGRLRLRTDVPAGHKFALRDIPAGDGVIKYGWPIGRASEAIPAGAHAHAHNLKTALCGLEDYVFAGTAAAAQPPTGPGAAPSSATFRGYRRSDGRVGTRNEIWIIATVGCVEKVCERIAAVAGARYGGRVDGVHAITHPFGCSQLGDDLTGTRSVLAALAAHPNAGGVLVVGLGCESNQLGELLEASPFLDRRRIRWIVSQDVGDEVEAGLAAVADLVDVAARDGRADCPVSDLVIGVKCGGSDGFSGLTANPLVGRMTDRVTAAGGASILTEIPEIFGAERLLMARAQSREVFDALVNVVNDFKRYFIDHGQPVYENPSPGNIAGGITTLEEKSLGAVQKAGRASVADVIRYGERARRKGLTILEAPGNDAVSSTALVAAGASVLLFTTGRGTPLGFPAPTIKISSSSALAARKARWIDFDAGIVVEGAAKEQAEDALFDLVLDVAGGKRTRNEDNDERSIAIWKRGVTL